MTSEAGSENAMQLLSVSLRILALEKASYHTKSPTTLRLPCWRGHMEVL